MSSLMPSPAPSFPRFSRLPPEIQDMIWDEALKHWCILFFDFDWNPETQRRDFIQKGFDPGTVALSCRDAAARWRKMCPRHTLLTSGVLTPRITPDLSVLVPADEEEVEFFLESERPESLDHLHLVMRSCDFSRGRTISLYRRLINSTSQRDSHKNSQDDSWRVAPAVISIDPSIQTLIKVRRFADQSFDSIAARLIAGLTDKVQGNRIVADIGTQHLGLGWQIIGFPSSWRVFQFPLELLGPDSELGRGAAEDEDLTDEMFDHFMEHVWMQGRQDEF